MATILNGNLVADYIKLKVREEIDKLKEKTIYPRLVVIIVGNDPASEIYVRNKHKTCLELGIESEVLEFDDISEKDLINQIEWLNVDSDVDGILVQMPLPKHINSDKVINAINPFKDVDGFHPINVGNLAIGSPNLIPCTPNGVMEMLDYYNIPIEGAKAVVIGRSNIVGKPMAALLQAKNATVTVCHTKTVNLKEETMKADIIVVATGKPNSLTADMVKSGVVVIDVGINRVNGKLRGDTDFEGLKDKVTAITPVPGGVGPLTIAMLMKNTVTAAKIRRG